MAAWSETLPVDEQALARSIVSRARTLRPGDVEALRVGRNVLAALGDASAEAWLKILTDKIWLKSGIGPDLEVRVSARRSATPPRVAAARTTRSARPRRPARS